MKKNVRMKTIAILSVLLLFLAGFAAVSASEKQAAVNLLGNGDFEFAVPKTTEDSSYIWPAGWVASGAGAENETCFLTSEDTYSGQYAMVLDGTEGGNMRVAAQVSGLVIGMPYEITTYVKCDGLVKGTRMYPRANAEYGTDFYQQSILVFSTGGKWEKITTRFVAPKKNPYIWLVNYGSGKVLFDAISVLPAADYAVNGSFEQKLRRDTSKGRLPGWESSTLSMDSDVKFKTGDAFDGETYITVLSDKEKKVLSSDLETPKNARYFEVNKTYTFHFAAMASRMQKATASVDYIDADKMIIGTEKLEFEAGNSVWQEYALDFVPPENAVRIRLSLSGAKGEISYDGVRVDFAGMEEIINTEDTAVTTLKPPCEGAENLIPNNDFEIVDTDRTPVGFAAYKGFDGGYVSVDSEAPHSGNNCVKIVATESGKNPWVRYLVTGVVPEAEYQVSAFLRRVHTLDDIGPHVKFEFYTNEEISTESANGFQDSYSFKQTSEVGKWSEVADTVWIPANTVSVAIYFRLNYLGEIYWDDVSFYMTQPPAVVKGETDCVFYYSDMKTGVYTVTPSVSFGDIPENAYMDFSLKKDGEVLEQLSHIPAQRETKFEFSVSKLAEQGQPYTVEAQYKQADGTLLGTAEKTVYRYDRPSRLTKDGKYMLDGRIFTPVFAYHIFHFTDEILTKVKQSGANVVQLGCGTDFAQTIKTLDTLQSYGLMAFISVYTNMKPAAHPDNYENSIAAINALKDHPATFAFAVMDEPYIHGTFDEVSELLEQSYKLVRDHDSIHPVYLVESSSARAFYKYDAMYCDLFGIDPYARYAYRMPTWIGEIAQLSKEATNGIKPSYNLLQAYELLEYTPTPNSMLHMAYQHYFEGGEGLGYFRFEAGSNETTLPMYEYELWDGALVLGEGGEIQELEDLFISGKYPIINQEITDAYSYILYVKDGAPYIILLNRKYNEETPVEISLTSYNGAVTLHGFTADLDKGIGMGGKLSGDGVFKMTLRPSEAAKYRLTLSEPVDFSVLQGMTYRDLGRHSWARMQIEALKAKGIVNDASDAYYLPGKNITRADFAGFLVRTLGLTADTEGISTFADVNPNTEFAKEIAVGKALGILNGIGENLYAPLAKISRQDMMTIISRAMALSGDNYDISAYPDADSIAAYALPHVKAMMQAGLVKGNADGTINPLGNTTRAEAAVIMYRILNK